MFKFTENDYLNYLYTYFQWQMDTMDKNIFKIGVFIYAEHCTSFLCSPRQHFFDKNCYILNPFYCNWQNTQTNKTHRWERLICCIRRWNKDCTACRTFLIIVFFALSTQLQVWKTEVVWRGLNQGETITGGSRQLWPSYIIELLLIKQIDVNISLSSLILK